MVSTLIEILKSLGLIALILLLLILIVSFIKELITMLGGRRE